MGPAGAVCQTAGFCLLSNVAIAASYALHVHRDVVRRVALIDFDAHHGNGTEACVRALKPVSWVERCATSTCSLQLYGTRFKPWLDDSDVDRVFFGSIHGFETCTESGGHSFFPGSGGPDSHCERPMVRNTPMPLRSSSAAWRQAMLSSLLEVTLFSETPCEGL